MAETRLSDPVTNFRFIVVSTRCRAGFSKVTGMREENDVVEYREGTDSSFVQKFPGLRKYPEMTFERGLTTEAKALIQWRNQVMKGVGYKDRLEVDIQTCPGTVARRVVMLQSWPSGLEISDVDAKSSEIAVESMTIQHEGASDKGLPSMFV
jgi:phage tail-like protein